ncbi:MAG: hypothetical protein ACXWC6_14730, partial [Ramlibacter sp.]
LRINLALGGSWGGPIDEARLPARLDIASVRVWRWAPGPAVMATPVSAAPADLAPGPLSDRPATPVRWGR